MGLKLILINGLEQFGKVPLAGLAEKLGYSYLPFQDDMLIQFFENKLVWPRDAQVILDVYEGFARGFHGQSSYRTGISRDDIHEIQQPRINLEKALAALQLLRKNVPESIFELWVEGRNACLSAMTYKKVDTDPRCHLLYPTKAHQFEKNFSSLVSEFKVLNIRRNFVSWMNSRVRRYQYMVATTQHKWASLKDFRPKFMTETFKEYETYVQQSQGLQVNFDDMFGEETLLTFAQLQDFLGSEKRVDPETLRTEMFDVMGAMYPFEKAHSKFDDRTRYMSRFAEWTYNRIYLKKSPTRFDDLLARFAFVYDFLFHRVPFVDAK